MTARISEWLELAAVGVDAIGIAVIMLGFVVAVAQFVRSLAAAGGVEHIMHIQMIRCRLGMYIAFGLELMIVSDLVHSVVSRELEDLYFLAAIVLIRTLIGYFLNKEIEELRRA